MALKVQIDLYYLHRLIDIGLEKKNSVFSPLCYGILRISLIKASSTDIFEYSFWAT